jgi:hypothetical protein
MEKRTLRIGDILFDKTKEKGIIDDLIKILTFGPVKHVAIMADSQHVFETHCPRGAHMSHISTYDNKSVEIYRIKGLTQAQRRDINTLCQKLNGHVPYSVWDIVVHMSLFWAHPKIRGKAMQVLGTKKFMKCDELTKFILYTVTNDILCADFEASNPNEFYQTVIEHPYHFQRVV